MTDPKLGVSLFTYDPGEKRDYSGVHWVPTMNLRWLKTEVGTYLEQKFINENDARHEIWRKVDLVQEDHPHPHSFH